MSKFGQNQFWPEPSLAKPTLAKSTIFGQSDQNQCFTVVSQFPCLAIVGNGRPSTKPPGHPLPNTAPPRTAQNFALFPSPVTIFILSSLLVLGPPGSNTTTRELQICTFEDPGLQKPPIFHEKTPPSLERILRRERVKKKRNFGRSRGRAQHNTTQHNTTQHNTTQHNTTQHHTTQHNTTIWPKSA